MGEMEVVILLDVFIALVVISIVFCALAFWAEDKQEGSVLAGLFGAIASSIYFHSIAVLAITMPMILGKIFIGSILLNIPIESLPIDSVMMITMIAIFGWLGSLNLYIMSRGTTAYKGGALERHVEKHGGPMDWD